MKKSLCTRVIAVALITILIILGLFGINTSAGSIGDLLPDDGINFKYQELSNGNIMITGADKYPSELVIPAQINGKKVEKISLHAFSYKWQLETVVISEGIEVIGEYAFSECSNLKNVVIPDSVRVIEDNAFYYCDKIKEVTMVGAESIGQVAFSHCTALVKIYISNNLKEVRWGAFANCDSLTDVYYAGKEEDLYYLEIESYNDPLLNANLHFYALEPEYLLGDVNGDGRVSILDATAIQRHLAQIEFISVDRIHCADVDKNGQVSITDATMIQRTLANLP